MVIRNIRQLVSRAHRRVGATIVEYAVITAIISIAGVVLLVAIGQRTTGMLDQMNSNFPH